MATFNPQVPSGVNLAGVTPTFNTCSAGGDTVPLEARGTYMLHFRNTGGAPITVTLDDPTSSGPPGATAYNPDLAIGPVAATTGQTVQVISASRFRDPTTGNMSITYSASPTMTFAILGPL